MGHYCIYDAKTEKCIKCGKRYEWMKDEQMEQYINNKCSLSATESTNIIDGWMEEYGIKDNYPKFEYTVLSDDELGETGGDLNKVLNLFGENGWELTIRVDNFIVFKREIY